MYDVSELMSKSTCFAPCDPLFGIHSYQRVPSDLPCARIDSGQNYYPFYLVILQRHRDVSP